MGSKVLAWFKELPPLQKAATGGGVGVVGALALFLLRGLDALLLALAIGLVVALVITGIHLVLKKRASGQGKTFSQELLKHIKKAKSEIGEQFERALAELKSNHVDIYNLPWFFFVGEPQSGKTFTIKSSGVDLPIGTEGISGAGGTRDCDFWFTSEAVILDTAGRLTVQQDEVIDRQQWNEVLRLLKRFRANCPINGALLCIPCTSLLEDDLPTREKKAEVIRNRLKEIQKELGIHFPIFLIITKVDLVLGFEPFFKRLPVLERKQLLGWSNEARFDQPFNPAAFGPAFDAVCEDLHRFRLKLLNEEDSPEIIDQYYVFPEEFGALKAPLADYLNKIFLTKPYIQPGFFRGFYFTSSLQEGRAIPQAIQSILGGIGDHYQRPSGSLQEIQARSSPFFVRDVYTRKVFPEKGLVLRSDRSKLMNALVRGTALWGGGTMLALCLIFLILSFFRVGSELEGPRDIVAKIRDGKDGPERCLVEDKQDGKLVLTLDGDLGSKIQEWELGMESASWARRILRPRSAASDPALIEDLKKAYRHHFQNSHLLPFFRGVLGRLRENPPNATWKEFKTRSGNLLRLDEVLARGASESEKPEDRKRKLVERLRGLNEFYLAPTTPPRPVEDLLPEFERFLVFDGDPSSRRGEIKDLWQDLGKSAANLQNLLMAEILDPGTLAPGVESAGQDFGARYQDDLLWWRKLLSRCQQVDRAYQDLLKIVQSADGREYRPPRTFAADRVTFQDQLQKPWEARFQTFQDSWSALKAHLDGAGAEELLQSRLTGQRAAIDTFYRDLLLAVDGLKDSEARSFVEKVNQEKLEVAGAVDRFEKAIIDRFRSIGFMIDFKPPPAPAGEGGGKATAGGRASLAAYASDVHDTLTKLDTLLKKNPSELVESLKALRRSNLKEFSEALDNYYQKEKEATEAVKLSAGAKGDAPAGSPPAPPPDFWSRPGLDKLMDAAKAGKFTDTFRQILDAYLALMRDRPGSGGESARVWDVDLWYFNSATMKPLGSDTLLKIDPACPYRKECFTSLQTHFEAIKKFLDGRATEKLLLLDLPEYSGNFEKVFSTYKGRYLDFWRGQGEGVLSLDDFKDLPWKEFKAKLKGGFGQGSADVLIRRLKETIALASDQVAGVDDKTPWVESAKRYTKNALPDLQAKLGAFAHFVEGLPEVSVPALAVVRAKENKAIWLEGFPTMVETLFPQPEERESDLFAPKLIKLSEMGKGVLLLDAQEKFKAEWEKLAREQGPVMEGKFPFLGNLREQTKDLLCPLLRGEEEGQVQNKQFKELLGNKGAITEMVRKYEGCLVAYSEGAEAEAEYGLRIGKERREFFKASKSLRSFIFDESDRYRQIKFKVMNPKESFAELKELLTESSSGIGIYKDFPNCEFSINRGLPGESRHRIEGNVMGKSSIDLVWKADERLDIGKVPKAGFYVIHQADSKRVQNVPLAKRLNPEDVGCYGERENAGKDRPIDEIELKFEAHGFWSFVLFLEVYGFPRSEDLGTEGDRKIWWVRATLPPIKTASGISTGDSRVESYEPVAYLKVLLNDKALDPLPDWASVSKTE